MTRDGFQMRVPKRLTDTHRPSETLSRRCLSVLSQESRWKSRLWRLKSTFLIN